ncbi:MAG: hypothetical protein OEZ06_13500 [Myxococcales bacterium]|nr:hypothetical protein [Myxococcales bacterium]
MQRSSIIFCASLLAFAGCAPQGETRGEGIEVATSSAALTVDECDAQLNSCLAGPLAWLFAPACYAQHATCLVTASLPEPVSDAVTAAEACANEAAACADGANALELVTCGVEEAECLAAVLDVQIDVDATLEGAGECAADAAGCITSAASAEDLASCGIDLTACIEEQAAAVVDGIIPDAVTETIDSVVTCAEELDACVVAAADPAELVACGELNAQCVAATLDVTLPDVPAEDLATCATEATECTLAAESLADVGACADELLVCAEAAAEPLLNPICVFFPFLCL